MLMSQRLTITWVLSTRSLGDLKRAKDCHERALDVRRRKLGPEHVYVAKSYNNLAVVHWKLGDLEKAKDCHE